jgi:uncharacterized protein (DUF2235 family)
MGQANGNVRQLLVFLDGTNNTLTGRRTDTNVLHLFEHLSKRRDPQQVLYYDPGVGSPNLLPSTGLSDRLSRRWERLSGLASGRGIFENVGQAYMFIVNAYRPGDQIFIFGFSRGAFTARSVAGMIHLFGLIRPQHEALLQTLVRVYFARSERDEDVKDPVLQSDSILDKKTHRHEIGAQVRESFTSDDGRDAGVRFIGVWDTVATVGLWPFSLAISSKATVHGKRIAHVRQALALDEHRAVFEPRLYSEDNFGSPHETQSLTQLWFRGVHCDAGGGYVTTASGLSNEALRWMADQAHLCGMRCDPEQVSADAIGLAKGSVTRVVHDPLREMGMWALVGMHVRDTTHALGSDHGKEPVKPVAHPTIASAPERSVWQNYQDLLWAGGIAVAAILLWLIPGVRHTLDADSRMAKQQAWGLLQPDQALRYLSDLGASRVAGILGFDLLFIVFYALFLSIVLSRAFARAAGWRRAGDGPSRVLTGLGHALPLLVVSDLTENVLTINAAWMPWPGLATAVMIATGLVSWIKLLALLGGVLLLLRGLLMPGKTR